MHRNLAIEPCRRSWLLAVALLLSSSTVALPQSGEPIKYTLRFPAPHTHYVEVEAAVPTGGNPQVELMMAVWTPGSYLVREYARNVEGVSAQTPDHQPLRVDKSRKNRWRVQTGGAPTVLVAYRVYAREMSVRTNWVEDGFALLNGAPTFLTLVETGSRPHEVRLVLPPPWSTTMTSLPAVSEGEAHTYLAADFDTLVDSPIVAGNPAVYEFDLDGTPHYLVNVNEGGVWDGPRSAEDVETIVGEHRRMWGFLPYDRYLFLNMITEAGGALEHRNSTVLMTSRWRAGTPRRYLGWLNTVSHEYFHAWNAKRLRPVELGPFDYESEVYTKSLWIVEGLTQYYSNLALHRAGLSTQVQYLASLSNQIGQLQTTPGRLVQPVEQASYDAWIEFYRPDENSPNTAVSYYTKGAVIGFLLDARIRKATAGAKSLDDVMRLAYQRYAGDRGFTPEQFRATAEEVAGRDLSAWFVTVLETTAELDYTEALDWFGLELSGASTEHGQAWLGLVTRADGDRLLVSQVRRETPAYEAGFDVSDEIVAIGDYRVTAREWSQRLQQHSPGEMVSILVSRRGRLKRLDATFAAEPVSPWQLALLPNATTAQVSHLNSWLDPQ